ncbi:hypothetical protein LCGC14_0862930 [marine sediment metagenome]|uniref:Uncharacterized protein n=1 Tax=marine sediment metagenome TaxID=412755 RepID=A0A0F9RRI2_9ZZZZ
MKKEKELQKPTDEILRKQIKSSYKSYDLFWCGGLIMGLILILLFGELVHGLMLGFIMFIMASKHGINGKLDKIRLEIRENKR